MWYPYFRIKGKFHKDASGLEIMYKSKCGAVDKKIEQGMSIAIILRRTSTVTREDKTIKFI